MFASTKTCVFQLTEDVVWLFIAAPSIEQSQQMPPPNVSTTDPEMTDKLSPLPNDLIEAQQDQKKPLLSRKPFIGGLVLYCIWSLHDMAYVEVFSFDLQERLFHIFESLSWDFHCPQTFHVHEKKKNWVRLQITSPDFFLDLDQHFYVLACQTWWRREALCRSSLYGVLVQSQMAVWASQQLMLAKYLDYQVV